MNAIHLPSGDQSASESCPDRVNCTKVPPSRHSHKSRRKVSCSQSARDVPISTECPSGEMLTSLIEMPLKNSSKLIRGLAAVWPKTEATRANRTMEWFFIFMRSSKTETQLNQNLRESGRARATR